MPCLLILRHGKTERMAASAKDFDRALIPRGRADAAAIGLWIAEHDQQPDRILCSTARRAEETLEAVRPKLAPVMDVRLLPELYGASAEKCLSLIHAQAEGAGRVLLIGHNPGLHDLALELAQGPEDLPEALDRNLPTAGLTIHEFNGAWKALAPGSARLVHFVTPKLLAGR